MPCDWFDDLGFARTRTRYFFVHIQMIPKTRIRLRLWLHRRRLFRFSRRILPQHRHRLFSWIVHSLIPISRRRLSRRVPSAKTIQSLLFDHRQVASNMQQLNMSIILLISLRLLPVLFRVLNASALVLQILQDLGVVFCVTTATCIILFHLVALIIIRVPAIPQSAINLIGLSSPRGSCDH